MIEIVLGIGFIGSLAAFFVMWSFYDGQKKLTQEEREKRWDEISMAVGLENELERSKAQEKCSADAVMWYAEMLMDTKRERDALQDRLSALLCPMNDHVWRDGRCVKCGRVQDGTFPILLEVKDG